MTIQSDSFRLLSGFSHTVFARVCFFSTLLFGSAAHSANPDVKIKEVAGRATNTITSLVPIDENTLLIDSDVVGKLTHFGKFIGGFHYVAELSATTIELTGEATFTNTKGEKLFLAANIVEHTETSPYLVEGTLTIIGGTGHYNDATGSIEVHGLDGESLTDTLGLHGVINVSK
jgi:hypothetical protein